VFPVRYERGSSIPKDLILNIVARLVANDRDLIPCGVEEFSVVLSV
jgi:hypothetical protein